MQVRVDLDNQSSVALLCASSVALKVWFVESVKSARTTFTCCFLQLNINVQASVDYTRLRK